MPRSMSRSEREAMEEFAIREWCQQETAYENQFHMNIELIHLKMCEVWTHSPNTVGETWDDFSNTPPWNPTIQDVKGMLPWCVGGKLLEVLGMGHPLIDFITFPLQPQHIEYVKHLIDSFVVYLSEDEDDEELPTDGDDYNREIEERIQNLQPRELFQDSDNDSDDTEYDEWEESERVGQNLEWPTEDAHSEIEGKKKELCMDGINLLDSIMNSGECMKEVDYLKMCNIFKGLYM